MKTIYADVLITNSGPELRSARLTVDALGTILEISTGERQWSDTYFPGVVIPGFVNAHCHLELSHLRGLISPLEDGMAGFIRQVYAQRLTASETKQVSAMIEADREMEKNGIVAVGDISNFSLSADVKKNSRLYYHTFIELVGLNPERAEQTVADGVTLLNIFRGDGHLMSNLTPHAPYSVVPELYKELFSTIHPGDPLSIHMQESEDELLFCSSTSGPLADFFISAGIDFTAFSPFGDIRPMQKLLPLFPRTNRLQLVHNTVTTAAEIVKSIKNRPKLYWCLCPSANRYITGRLPDVSALYYNNAKVTIGTDSLASNSQLSILEELKLISSGFGSIPFDQLVKWSTLNGAEFLGIDHLYGKVKPGMKPGLLVLDTGNTDDPVLHEKVTCQRII